MCEEQLDELDNLIIQKNDRLRKQLEIDKIELLKEDKHIQIEKLKGLSLLRLHKFIYYYTNIVTTIVILLLLHNNSITINIYILWDYIYIYNYVSYNQYIYAENCLVLMMTFSIAPRRKVIARIGPYDCNLRDDPAREVELQATRNGRHLRPWDRRLQANWTDQSLVLETSRLHSYSNNSA